MQVGYIRLSRSGPSRDEQEAALIAAGVVLDVGSSLYVDQPSRRGRQATFDQRDEAIRALRVGDRLVFHSAPRLGQTDAEIRAAAVAVSGQGAALYDCAEGVEVQHHSDAGRLLAWAQAGAAKAAAERMGKARQGITRRGVPPKALAGDAIAAAKAAWEARHTTGASAVKIAAEFAVSVRTLYREAAARKWRMTA